MTGYTRVGSFPTRGHAELALTFLQDHGIHAVVIADDGGGAYPPMPPRPVVLRPVVLRHSA